MTLHINAWCKSGIKAGFLKAPCPISGSSCWWLFARDLQRSWTSSFCVSVEAALNSIGKWAAASADAHKTLTHLTHVYTQNFLVSGWALWVITHLFNGARKNILDMLPVSAPLLIFLMPRKSVSWRRKQIRSSQHQLKDCQKRMERKILGSVDGLANPLCSEKHSRNCQDGWAVPAQSAGQSGPAGRSEEALCHLWQQEKSGS